MSERSWHAGKPKKKPDYAPDAIVEEVLSAVSAIYNNTDEYGRHPSLQSIVNQLPEHNLNPIKVRKLLITAGVYESPIAKAVGQLYEEGKTPEEIMELLKLSRASVHSYLPYRKVLYKLDQTPEGERSVNADRQQLYRDRQKAVKNLQENPGMDALWETIVLFAGYPFKTSRGLEFSYHMKKDKKGGFVGEVFVNRKEKSITRKTIEMAYQKAIELNGEVSGPKKLRVFGASYLYPMFIRFGLISAKDKTEKK